MPRKTKSKKKANPGIREAHLHYELVNDLVEKTVCTTDVEEKIRWSWGVMKECEVLESSKSAKKHIEKCKSCEEFLNSRKLLAKLIIQGGRTQA
jgi:hypothetical protein